MKKTRFNLTGETGRADYMEAAEQLHQTVFNGAKGNRSFFASFCIFMLKFFIGGNKSAAGRFGQCGFYPESHNCRRMTGPLECLLSVDFFPVANGEHNNDMDRIVNRVNDAIVSHAQAVFVGIAQFFCLAGSWVGLQFKQTVFQERLNEIGQRKEFFFRAAGDGNLVAGHSLCFLFASDRNFRKGLQGSSARSCAIARSVKSSRRRLSLIMLSTTWFLTACGNIRNAIINTCAVACWELR
ncbi:MAG: hypothetical protein Q7R35_05135 [Elusimicrobiota bacterium]|nr:hypothetical protein [Elusimicrobiota bacterium]